MMLINEDIKNAQHTLLNHPLYTRLDSLETFQIFMGHHVYAVWDFMSLLKALQLRLTNTQLPWVPQGDPAVRQMINEIVLGEESDEVVGGLSHFEWYIIAMKECGADTTAIESFVESIKHGEDFYKHIESLPKSIRDFVEFTLDLVLNGETYEIAAAFTIGRENLIPSMFMEFVEHLADTYPEQTASLVHYFNRHIEVDGDEHGPLAMNMLTRLCDNNQQKLERCQQVAVKALELRTQLWEGIYAAIEAKESKSLTEAVA